MRIRTDRVDPHETTVPREDQSVLLVDHPPLPEVPRGETRRECRARPDRSRSRPPTDPAGPRSRARYVGAPPVDPPAPRAPGCDSRAPAPRPSPLLRRLDPTGRELLALGAVRPVVPTEVVAGPITRARPKGRQGANLAVSGRETETVGNAVVPGRVDTDELDPVRCVLDAW